jgi:FKBP-type peptidyl-prolyl cis-trans isomerase SlyD
VPHTSPLTAAADAADDHLLHRLLGSLIAFEFRVFDEAGEELGSNVDGKPRIFEIGAGEVLPALERELAEMRENETRSIVLPPGEAYGPIRREAFREFPLDGIPEQARRIGRKVVGRARDGSEDLFDIVEIRDTTAVIDMNHPLAGRTLRFELRVLRRDS